jgi:outer membrane protein assembly factor BamB
MKTQAIAPTTAVETSTFNQQPKGQTQMNRLSSLMGQLVGMRHARTITLGFVLLACANSFAQWPQFRQNSTNTGNNTFESIISTKNVSTLAVNWTFPLTVAPGINATNTSPVVSGYLSYFQSVSYVFVVDSNNLYALPLACTGAGCTQSPPVNTPAWTFPYQTNMAGCPSSPAVGYVLLGNNIFGFDVASPVVYFNDACNANLYAVNAQTGQMIWSQPTLYSFTNAQIAASPTIGDNGTIYLAGDYVYAFDGKTGNPLNSWMGGRNGTTPGLSVSEVGAGTSSSALGNLQQLHYGDTLFVGGTNGFFAIDTANGSTRTGWPISQYGLVQNSSPSAPESGCLYWDCYPTTLSLVAGTSNVQTSKGEIVSFNPQTGTPAAWQYSDTTNPTFNSSPAMATEVINGQPQQLAYVASMYAWSFSVGHKIFSGQGGYLTALDATDGNPFWQSVGLAPIGFSSPAVANGVVFVADLGGGQTNGQIYAFDAKGISDGNGQGCQILSGRSCTPLWSYDLGYNGLSPNFDLIGSPAVANGMVFETAGPMLYAFGL